MEGAGTRTTLLAWYDANARALPWRVRGGASDPYRVWLSEIMLQQTGTAAVAPYFEQFLAQWPSVAALAAAPREAVLSAWAGLGYYARARNLHAAAQRLASEGFPDTEADWRALPGVGAYTAAAIAAIAFGRAANAVDGNIERVMARWFAVETPLPDAKQRLRALAATFVTDERPGDWAQALMDLGATICTPRAPKCSACPVRASCAAHAAGSPEAFPRKRAKTTRPRRFGVAFWLERAGLVQVTTRPDEGLLGGMTALPSTPWRDAPWTEEEARAYAPAAGDWVRAGAVSHVFTHFALEMGVWVLRGAGAPGAGWRRAEEAARGMPTVFRKAAERARLAVETPTQF
ncbi:MAG: A/G-specific adenine glycosylase [Hyphomonadaceae bacterium]